MGTIYKEIKQTRPFAHPHEEAFVCALRTTDLLRSSLEKVLAAWGISVEQYNALRILAGAPSAGHPTLEVAARMVSRAPNITRLVDKLIEKRLVRRDRISEDRRIVQIRITPEGLKVLNEANPAVKRRILQMLSSLDESRLKLFIECLDSIRANIA